MTATAQRRIGRILSLGFPLPGTLVDNYNFLTAPAFFDYDALVIDIAHVLPLIEGVLDGSVQVTSFAGDAVRAVAMRSGEVAVADLLVRRIAETRSLLNRGGLVVLFAAPPGIGVRVAGAEPLDSYFWLRDRAQALVEAVRPADGARAVVTDYEHPLAAFIDRHAANVAYRAYFDVPAADLAVFAESAGGKPIAVDVRADGGRVVVLPTMTPVAGTQRYAMSEDLQAGIRRILGVMAEGRAPGWTANFALPGLDERRQALELARVAHEDAAAASAAADRSYDELDRFRRLLWQEGELGLGNVIVDALRIIGFDVVTDAQGNIELRTEPAPVLVEYDASETAVGMAAHHRLRQRIERAIERRGAAPRGLLLVSGYRLRTPDERPQQVEEPVGIAAETMGYAIGTTHSLFAAVAAHMRREDTAPYREKLLSADNPLDRS